MMRVANGFFIYQFWEREYYDKRIKFRLCKEMMPFRHLGDLYRDIEEYSHRRVDKTKRVHHLIQKQYFPRLLFRLFNFLQQLVVRNPLKLTKESMVDTLCFVYHTIFYLEKFYAEII